MEVLIEQYLYQHGECPLPEIGSLRIRQEPAIFSPSDQRIAAPQFRIELIKSEIPSAPFIEFIAERAKVTKGEASLLLESYCQDLKKLSSYKEMNLQFAGKFYVDAAGSLVFKQDPLPREFYPSVAARLVQRAKPSLHEIQVGDKVSNNELMTEYLADKPDAAKDRWWIWAIVFALLSLGLIIFYFTSERKPNGFGNSKRIEASPEPKTYRTDNH